MLFFLCCGFLAFSQFSLVFDYVFLGGLISGLGGISAMISFMWMGIRKFFGPQICADLRSHFCSHQHTLAPEVAEKIQ
jgi:hypothetical protein